MKSVNFVYFCLTMVQKGNSTLEQDRQHLLLLDALRGVAALVILYYHCFECFGHEILEGSGIYTQHCDHGYLAVDFFFLLSGFVIAYAYDQRRTMGFGTFAKRRLIRLHPMVVAGAFIGIVTFLIDGGRGWDGTVASTINIVLAFVLTLLMLPVFPGWGADVRGNGEMFPLNGPQWSLFFEYIGNIIYVLILRRLPTKALALVVAVCGVLLGAHVLQCGYLGSGWSFVDNGFFLGLLRMMFSYSLGMLLCRVFLKTRKGNPISRRLYLPLFLACGIVLTACLAMPFVGDPGRIWMNGLYILLLLVIVFPAVIWTGACAGEGSSRLCAFLGELSYPLYIVHYPLMYLFYRYHGFPNVSCTMSDVWPMAVVTFIGSIILAVIFLYAYDKPVRRWLSRSCHQ